MLFGRRSEPLTFVSPLAATLAVSLAALACSKGEAGPTTRARIAPQVVVAKVVARDVPVEVHAPVDLRALEQVDVGSKVLGYVDAVLVDRGIGCARVKSSHWCGPAICPTSWRRPAASLARPRRRRFWRAPTTSGRASWRLQA